MNQVGDRYVVASIDLSSSLIRLDDHYAKGTNSTTYRIDLVLEHSIQGTRTGGEAFETISLDRVSGRITLSTDATKDADSLWNEEKQQIGGFDLSGGKRLWLTATLDCQPAKRVL